MNGQDCSCLESTCQPTTPNPWSALVRIWTRLNAALQQRVELAQQLRQLREMDDRLLKDIGLSRADVARIAGPQRGEATLDPRYRAQARR